MVRRRGRIKKKNCYFKIYLKITTCTKYHDEVEVVVEEEEEEEKE